MKKLFFTAFALLIVGMATAQTVKDDIEASRKRMAELKQLVDKQPKACGEADIDNFARSVSVAAAEAIGNSERLSEYYYRQIGQQPDGMADASLVKPSLGEWTELAVKIGKEAQSLKTAKDDCEKATNRLKALTDEAKNGNAMAKMKAAKKVKAANDVMTYGTNAMSILVTEVTEQAKIIQKIIEGVKSNKSI